MKLKKYEEQKGLINELGHEIMKLKQQLDEFKDLNDEWNGLNKKMDKLYSLGLIDNECSPV